MGSMLFQAVLEGYNYTPERIYYSRALVIGMCMFMYMYVAVRTYMYILHYSL